jgi:predicted Zn finger-like uncharacterized protein
MALATRCPNCQVLFRVVADQLKLRGGLVRCGACRHVFDAIGSLTYIEDSAAGAPEIPAARKAAPPTLHATAVATPMLRTPLDEGKATPARAAESDAGRPDYSGPPTLLAPQEDRIAAAKEPPKDHAKRSSRGEAKRERGEPKAEAKEPRLDPRLELRRGMREEPKGMHREEDAAHADEEEVASPPPTPKRRKRRETHEAPPPPEPQAQATAPNDDLGIDEVVHEPEFLRNSREDEKRSFSVVYGGGSILLSILLVLQLAVIFRTEITTRWPQWRPMLVQVCGLFGCNVGWPTRADLLAVVGTELQAIPGTDVLELTAVIRNRANFKVALPAIEVTLTDTTNRTLARKVFAPVDYLGSAGEPSSRIDDGLGASSDLTVRVAFEARGINAVGFVVYPFYL